MAQESNVKAEIQVKLPLRSAEEASTLCGLQDAHVKLIAKKFDVGIVVRDHHLVIHGIPVTVARVERLLRQLLELQRSGHTLSAQEVAYAAGLAQEGREGELAGIYSQTLTSTSRGKPVQPRTSGQKRYLEAIRAYPLVFGIGPAGTGKTYLAVAAAVAAFRSKEIARIILTRPAVEAGEKLGFLPGDLQDKVDPYLRPLYDALYEILGYDTYRKYVERGLIEIAPLAYMRGRTLGDAFVILDEAQNTTPEQMKMFLTRLGWGSRAVVTGDITQIDLPRGLESGLLHARQILEKVDGLSFIYLNENDVVRHPLLRRIIRAYEEHGAASRPQSQSPDNLPEPGGAST